MQGAARREDRRIKKSVPFLTMNPACGFIAALLLAAFAGVRESAGGIIFEKERIDAVVVTCDTLAELHALAHPCRCPEPRIYHAGIQADKSN
jgi:hypothetical protein